MTASLILVLRCLIFLLTLETCFRYGQWYLTSPDRRRRPDGQAPALHELMAGIALAAGAMAVFAAYGLLFGGPPTRQFFFAFMDTILAAAFAKHLFPAWRISCRFERLQIWGQLGLRVFGSIVLALVLYEVKPHALPPSPVRCTVVCPGSLQPGDAGGCFPG